MGAGILHYITLQIFNVA